MTTHAHQARLTSHRDYFRPQRDGRLQCTVCPRRCTLREGQRGACFVRGRRGDRVDLLDYGRASGFCIDPIEKKPLNHFYPGSSVLSFGTAGCNLACKFCQNWDISKSREVERLGRYVDPARVAQAACESGARSVAFTYNDPVIFLEYAIDVARACAERSIHSVAVSAAYVEPEAREDFFAVMDAANIDLKAFTEQFYRKICGGSLAPVLDTLRYLREETRAWVEITTLLIPGENDSDAELDELTAWVGEHMGADTPLHFSAFHPDFRMLDIAATPHATLLRAREWGQRNGLKHVYTGNVHDPASGSTYCAACSALLIERDWYQLGRWRLDRNGACPDCGARLAGRFDGPPGGFGRRRIPLALA